MLAAVVTIFLIITGMGVALLGSIKLSLTRKLDLEEHKVGTLVSLFGFMTIPAVLLAGFFTDAVGYHAVLIAGAVMFLLGVLAVGQSKSFIHALIGVVFIGAGWSALTNVVNVLCPTAFLSADDMETKISFATNLANFFFGMGAFLFPLATAVVLKKRGLATLMTVLAVVVLIPIGLSFGVKFPGLGAVSSAVSESSSSILSNPMIWLSAIGLFFYTPTEASMGVWSTTLLTDRGVDEVKAGKALSAFWLCYMVSRLLTAFFIADLVSSAVGSGASNPAMLILCAIGALVSLAVLLKSKSSNAGVVAVVGAGLTLGPVFPTLIAILLSNAAPELRGRAVGLFFAVGGIGWSVIPLLIGAYAKRTNVAKSFRVLFAMLALLIATAVTMIFVTA